MGDYADRSSTVHWVASWLCRLFSPAKISLTKNQPRVFFFDAGTPLSAKVKRCSIWFPDSYRYVSYLENFENEKRWQLKLKHWLFTFNLSENLWKHFGAAAASFNFRKHNDIKLAKVHQPEWWSPRRMKVPRLTKSNSVKCILFG